MEAAGKRRRSVISRDGATASTQEPQPVEHSVTGKGGRKRAALASMNPNTLAAVETHTHAHTHADAASTSGPSASSSLPSAAAAVPPRRSRRAADPEQPEAAPVPAGVSTHTQCEGDPRVRWGRRPDTSSAAAAAAPSAAAGSSVAAGKRAGRGRSRTAASEAAAEAPVAAVDDVGVRPEARAVAAAPRRRASAASSAAGVAGSAAEARQEAAAAAATRAATSTAVPSSAGAAASVPEASSVAPAISTAQEASATANSFVTPTKVGSFDYGDTVLSTYVDEMYEFYMEEEPQLNERMRGILVDWLVDVHTRYRQHPETFFLSVSILDRFLERTEVPRSMLQLFGATAMLIASKFCESFRREVRVDELVYICDQAYTSDQVRNAERLMLSALDFRVGAPTPFIFLSRIMRVARASTQMSLLAAYLAERMQQEYSMLRYRPSAVAAAAANIALRTLQGPDAWTAEVAEAAGYDMSAIKFCIRDMENCLAGAQADEAAPVLGAVDRKYSLPRYGEVALLPRAALADDGPESNAE